MSNSQPIYLTSQDVCDALHISKAQLWRLRHILPAPIQFVPGGKKIYVASEVHDSVAKQQKDNHDDLSLA